MAKTCLQALKVEARLGGVTERRHVCLFTASRRILEAAELRGIDLEKPFCFADSPICLARERDAGPIDEQGFGGAHRPQVRLSPP